MDRHVAEPTDQRFLLDTLWDELDDDEREVLVLHWLDGFTQNEIAEMLGVWRRTVGRRLDRVRAKAKTLRDA